MTTNEELYECITSLTNSTNDGRDALLFDTDLNLIIKDIYTTSTGGIYQTNVFKEMIENLINDLGSNEIYRLLPKGISYISKGINRFKLDILLIPYPIASYNQIKLRSILFDCDIEAGISQLSISRDY